MSQVTGQSLTTIIGGMLKPAGIGKARNAGPSPKSTIQLNKRQRLLAQRYRYFRCKQYEGWKLAWDGQPVPGAEEHDHIVNSGEVPPGMFDAGKSGKDIPPAKYRIPSTPYNLAKVITLRFSGLLFGDKHHPTPECDDPQTQDWLDGFCKASSYWKAWGKARNLGGAQGSVAVGFKFVDGAPVIEVHDARWSSPVFIDRQTKELKSIEVLYQFPEDVRNDEGKWEQQWFWYRRVIDQQEDRTWLKVPVNELEPDWDQLRCSTYKHGYGFCPVVWVTNVDVDGEIDGDSDCHGTYELIDDINILYSSASTSTKNNCDPTVTISSDAEFDKVKLGSGNALQVEKGGSLGHLESSGAGAEKAIALAGKLQTLVMDVARCVLDRNEGGPSRTVAEVEHNYSSMIEQCDILRTSYGELGSLRLLKMVVKAAKILAKPIYVVDGATGASSPVVREISIPPRKVVDPKTGQTQWLSRTLGEFGNVDLRWPDYFTPSQDEVLRKVQTMQACITSGFGSIEHALEYIQKDLGIKDVRAFIEKIKAERASGMLPPIGGAMGSGFNSMEDQEPANDAY